MRKLDEPSTVYRGCDNRRRAGNLTQKVEIQVEGEMATLKETVNSMVDQLSVFASEATRVALEVGMQGILGGQARVEGVQGMWADLTRNANTSLFPCYSPFFRRLHADTTGDKKWQAT